MKLNFNDVALHNETYDAITKKNKMLQSELNKAIDEIIDLKEKLDERQEQTAA